MPAKWEYTVLKVQPGGLLGGKIDVAELTSDLNAYGAEQWEIAGTFETTLGQGRSREAIIIFKRPRA